MTIDERIQFLVQSQESLGKNIEELHERMNETGKKIDQLYVISNRHEMDNARFHRALRAALEAWLDENRNGGNQ